MSIFFFRIFSSSSSSSSFGCGDTDEFWLCVCVSIVYYCRDAAVVQETGEGEAPGSTMDVFVALQKVLKTALVHDGLARGLREAVKALDRRQAHLCVLAGNCDEPNYVALVRALCDEHEIKLIKVPESKQLGECTLFLEAKQNNNNNKVFKKEKHTLTLYTLFRFRRVGWFVQNRRGRQRS